MEEKLLRSNLFIMRCLFVFFLSILYCIPAFAGKDWFKDYKHLELSISAGVDGIGIEAGMPVGDMFRFRAGYSYMPRVNVTSKFGIQVGEETDNGRDEMGNSVETRFDKLSMMLNELTGYSIDQSVDMLIEPTYSNFKFLFDIHPFRDKSWYLTAGLYAGPSRFAKSINGIADAPTLIAAGIYNNIYTNCYYEEPILFGVELTPDYRNQILSWGRMGMHIGDFKNQYKDDGTPVPFLLEPASDGMVHVEMKVNRVKPYLGFGYSRNIDKQNRFRISCDCGVLFWGGTPNLFVNSSSVVNEDGAPAFTLDGSTILTREQYWDWNDPDLEYEDLDPYLQSMRDQGMEKAYRLKHRINLTKDVVNVQGKPGRFVDFAKSLKVLPVLSLRFSYTFF